MNTVKLVASLLAAVSFALASAASAQGPAPGETIQENFSQAVPNIPGKKLVVREIVYAPGAASRPHRHAGSAFIYAYVVSGQVESQVDDGPARVYKAGESFQENPGSHHAISRNASKTEPAKLLAVVLVDSGETTLTIPDK